MKLVRWNPNMSMRWLNDFDRYVDRQLERPSWAANSEQSLAVDVSENDEGYVVKASVPGINPEEVKITFDDDVLTIKGEIVNESEEEEENFHIRERWYGSFGRSLRFPTNVDADAIEATYENGVLTLIVPKIEEEQPKRIEVKVA
ncbi:MAG: Hsp20/alpha crystallin family protein [Candidatus Promineifilaceae bacterium]|jgi:HSP20 family protein